MPSIKFLRQIFIISLYFLLTPTEADVAISKPLAGSSYDASSGSVDITLQWIESNATPLLTTIESYTFTVCTGPNSNIYAFGKVGEVTQHELDGSYKYTVTIENTIGADGYYYIQIYAVNPLGTTIHYSNRFELTGMSGTYEPSVGVQTAPPDPQTSLKGSEPTVLSIDSASFSVTYTLQTGTIRYAPMQTQPATKATMGKSDWVRRYPSSAVTYFSTIRHSLEQLSTITPGWDYQWTSVANWATPAGFPSANGGWYNPSDRLKLRIPTLRDTKAEPMVTATVTATASSS